MNVDSVLKQLDSLIEKYAYSNSPIPERQKIALRASALAAIQRLSPPNSAYLAERDTIEGSNEWEVNKLDLLMGVVDSLRHDYSVGAMVPVEDLIRAEVFDNFLEMAEYLLESGYKDPAAVLVGGVLEQHLRKLCLKAEIPTMVEGKPKRAEAMNADLATKAIYNKLDQKSVTAWLDLRNKAAHAEYELYSQEQVGMMLLASETLFRGRASRRQGRPSRFNSAPEKEDIDYEDKMAGVVGCC